MKKEINNLVWMHGDAAMSLAKAEGIACQFYYALVSRES